MMPLETFVSSLRNANFFNPEQPCSEDFILVHINNKHLAISYARAYRHNTRMGYYIILHGPDSVNRFGSTEEGCSDTFSCKVTNHLRHVEPVVSCKCLSNQFVIYVFVSIKANNESISVLSPFLQLFNEIFAKSFPWARQIFFVCYKISTMFLI